MSEEDLSVTMSALDVADWRLRTFALYAEVRERAEVHPASAHDLWQEERNRMFGTHRASALNRNKKTRFEGLAVAPYDPAFRFVVPLTDDGTGERLDVETGTDGVVPFERIGSFLIPGLGTLAAWRLKSYGGGIFLPFRDTTAGMPGGSYGAGRYLLDTIKGAFLGAEGSEGDPEFVLDFNFAYNASCAYDEAWACPLPGPGNRLATPVPVGEMYRPELGA